MKTWYTIKAKAGETPTVSIMDDIGAWGVSAKTFLDDVRALPDKEISVEINSLGGDVFAGLAMYNGLRNSGKTINVKVLGVAASAASLVAMAGDTISMHENTFMMIHNPWTFASGNAVELRDQADLLDKIGVSLASTYAKRTGKTVEEVSAMLAQDTWLTAAEAVAAGFATKMLPASDVKATVDMERLPEKVRAVFASANKPPAPAPEGASPAPAPENTSPAPAPENTSPAPAPENTSPAPAPQAPDATYADQVAGIAVAHGLGVYAAVWALDPTLPTLEAVKARASASREIKALCALAKKDDLVDGLIRKGATVADARTDIFAALEAGSPHIDTSPSNESPQTTPSPTAGVTNEVWATYRKQTGEQK